MSLDICRRFIIGATIDNTSMRLWTYNRSMVMVSDPFNFITVRLFPYQLLYRSYSDKYI